MKRAYAYYLSGNYERALADCEVILTSDKDSTFVHELRGIIYSNLGKTLEAAEEYTQALNIENPSPLLMDKYREACKKLMDV
jgi:Tfp pilus assembly protein PilF